MNKITYRLLVAYILAQAKKRKGKSMALFCRNLPFQILHSLWADPPWITTMPPMDDLHGCASGILSDSYIYTRFDFYFGWIVLVRTKFASRRNRQRCPKPDLCVLADFSSFYMIDFLNRPGRKSLVRTLVWQCLFKKIWRWTAARVVFSL